MAQKKHINKFLAPTQSRDNPANLFMFMCFFFPWKKNAQKKARISLKRKKQGNPKRQGKEDQGRHSERYPWNCEIRALGPGTMTSNLTSQRLCSWVQQNRRSPFPSDCSPLICGLRVGSRGLEPPQGASGKSGPLRGLWVAHLVLPLRWKRTPLSEAPEEPSPRPREPFRGSKGPLGGAPKPLDPWAGFRPSCSAPRAAIEPRMRYRKEFPRWGSFSSTLRFYNREKKNVYQYHSLPFF